MYRYSSLVIGSEVLALVWLDQDITVHEIQLHITACMECSIC